MIGTKPALATYKTKKGHDDLFDMSTWLEGQELSDVRGCFQSKYSGFDQFNWNSIQKFLRKNISSRHIHIIQNKFSKLP